MNDWKRLENVLMFIGFLMLILAFIIPWFMREETAQLLGDSATPFVSAAAFLLLISANIMQQKELSLQREELRNTRAVFIKQSSIMNQQRFEGIVFQLLKLHNDIVRTMTLWKDNKLYEGRRVPYQMYQSFRLLYDNQGSRLTKNFKTNDHEDKKVSIIYENFYSKYEWNLVHYFNNIETYLITINSSDLEDDIKSHYYSMLFSQLSIPELQLLLYHSTFSEYNQELNRIVNQNNLVTERISSNHLVHKSHYPEDKNN